MQYPKSKLPVPTSTIHKILRNRISCGDFNFDGKTYAGKYEPIVSRDLWAKVQDVVDGRNRTKPCCGTSRRTRAPTRPTLRKGSSCCIWPSVRTSCSKGRQPRKNGDSSISYSRTAFGRAVCSPQNIASQFDMLALAREAGRGDEAMSGTKNNQFENWLPSLNPPRSFSRGLPAGATCKCAVIMHNCKWESVYAPSLHPACSTNAGTRMASTF
jgi:hypothetical protein